MKINYVIYRYKKNPYNTRKERRKNDSSQESE